MNYRHAFHAGNFADVVKHLALISILVHLKRKEAAFAVIDTHAGRGLYDLTGGEAKRSGEAASGVARLADSNHRPALLATYLDLVRSCGEGRYPGSPLIAAKLLRPQDRLIAVEKHPVEAQALAGLLRPFSRVRIMEADGYEKLPTLLPPPERRGLVLIDPPYETPDEFERAARAVGDIRSRFATGIVLIWFPVKSAAAASAFCGEVLQTGVGKLLRLDIDTGAGGEKMAAAGLLVVNPPFGFADEMRDTLDALAPKLGTGGGDAKTSIDWLAGPG
jgi:23S rRNA (adenine2030-N6)-methyltransferase